MFPVWSHACFCLSPLLIFGICLIDCLIDISGTWLKGSNSHIHLSCFPIHSICSVSHWSSPIFPLLSFLFTFANTEESNTLILIPTLRTISFLGFFTEKYVTPASSCIWIGLIRQSNQNLNFHMLYPLMVNFRPIPIITNTLWELLLQFREYNKPCLRVI